MAKSKLTEVQWQELITRNQAGESIANLSREFGLHSSSVLEALGKRGVQIKKNEGSSWKLNKAQKQEVCDLYLQGKTLDEIATRFDLRFTTIAAILKRRDIARRDSKFQAKLTTEDKKQIGALYIQGQSCPKIAPLFGIDSSMVNLVLKELGIDRRGASEAARLYSVNHDFFEKIDTEEKAYWLGFMAADGNVTNRNEVRLSLWPKDALHVLAFKSALQSEHPLRIGRDMARLDFASPKMASDLAQWGIVPKKSFIVWPPKLPLRLTRHYWRGVVDGDGCLTRSRGRFSIECVGSKAMMDGFAVFAHSVCVTKAQVRKKRNIWHFGVTGQSGKVLAKALYEGSSISLDRKFKLFLQAVYPETLTQQSD